MSVEDEFAARVRARREKAFAGAVRMRSGNADGFAKRMREGGRGAFAGQRQGRRNETFAGRRQGNRDEAFAGWLQGRTSEAFAGRRQGHRDEAFAGRLQGRTSEAFARHIMDGSVMWSEARMRGYGISPGTDFFSGTPFVFLKQQGRTSADNHYYRLLLRLERFLTNRKILNPEESAKQMIQKSLRNAGFFFKSKGAWHEQHTVQKELTVFRNIATIFVNRGSRPDLAKKAERELVKILSRAYHENNPEKQKKETHIYQRQITHEELVMTRRTVTELEEQVKKHKTLLFQLQKNIESAQTAPEPDVSRITGEVMKRMEREMHLERLRRGI